MPKKNKSKDASTAPPSALSNPMVLGGGVLVILVVAGLFLFFSKPADGTPGKFDSFAKCLSDKNVTMYGAFWCPHCQNEKKEFGSSFEFVHYVECSEPDGQTQTIACKDAKIDGYPTWQFGDGTRIPGEVPFESLAQKTNCTLPA